MEELGIELTKPARSSKGKNCLLLDEGLLDYDSAYQKQQDLVAKKKRGEIPEDYLLMVEHPDVYTYGRKSKVKHPADVSNVYFVERGGEVTFHNPGQLVCYPILSLSQEERDLHLYLRKLEWTVIDTLADFDIFGERREGATGVWLRNEEKKIASIGVAVSSWVTYHGCALNVENDLFGFSRINPCGFPSRVMTSMKDILGDRCPSLVEVKESFRYHFSKNLGRTFV